ncbi:phage tail sheath family protein [Salibacterium halotolerans]|uniref:Phage tail sheath protein n=1 Tax=Salibacterium halotolerans TaxID=1884432 RepID=A0A1I5MNK5_9BACI|nr:phage tail sheath family protein [Salibacterium halotolerans]SFP11182.1 hypothetical protein SAMN05518683_102292 [Salibacterium halotolerans]
MAYRHGIYTTESDTQVVDPVEAGTGLVVFGTAPVNLLDNPSEAVNKPIQVNDWNGAKNEIGYSEDWSKFTLCQQMDASFRRINAGPVIFVNVLNPTDHTASESAVTINVSEGEAVIEKEGVLLNSLTVSAGDGSSNYVEDTDYTADFNEDGHVVISILDSGSITGSDLTVTYDYLDPESVTSEDIIGGYDSENGTYQGIEVIEQVFPRLGVNPGLLSAPGWSHQEEIGTTLVLKSRGINGGFNAGNILDVKGNTKDDAASDKDTKLYDDSSSTICWPRAKISGKTYQYSAIAAALMVRLDAENDNVPYKSPSNKKISISAMVNDAGEEVYLDQMAANELNGNGIFTAINLNGWRTWGNNTAAYNDTVQNIDVKDRFIAVRRMFDWWGNSFMLSFLDRVDDPTNTRLIESVVDSENIRGNSLQGEGQIAGAAIEFRQKDNPTSDILDGVIKFKQRVAFYTPARVIENDLEFDPTLLTNALFGGGE